MGSCVWIFGIPTELLGSFLAEFTGGCRERPCLNPSGVVGALSFGPRVW